MPNETGRVMDQLPAHPPPGTAPAPVSATATAAIPSPPEPVSIRIVSLDYYMAPPTPGMDVCWSELEGVAVQKVPVVRIFGATPGGQKSCLHLHGIFPYFYIPYEDDMPQDTSGAIAYARRIALSLDAALSFSNTNAVNNSNVPGPAGAVDNKPGPSSQRQRVFGATIVRGIPFYGYHPEERPFIKLMLYDPKDVKKAASLLLAGAVFGRSFQPHESHVPYLLQFKIDLNLQGMGYLTLSKAMFRGKLPAAHAVHRQGWAQREIFQTQDGDDDDVIAGHTRAPAAVPSPGSSASPSSSSSSLPLSSKIWLESTVPASMRWGTGGCNTGLAARFSRAPQRQTTCDLEFDGHAEDVVNRTLLLRLPLAQTGPEIRMVESLAPMWEEERIRCGGTVPVPPPDVPRIPQQLIPAVAQCRQEFQSIEDQIKEALGISAAAGADHEGAAAIVVSQQQEPVQGEEEEGKVILDKRPRISNIPSQIHGSLLHATQAANEVAAFPSSQALPVALVQSVPAAGAAGEPGEQNPVNYSQYIDEAILTQMSVGEEDLPRGRPSFAAAGCAAGDGEGDGVFAGVEAEGLLFAQQRGDGFEDEEEEDLLLALAMQLTPASIPPSAAAAAAVGTARAAAGASSQPVESNSQVLPLSFPGSNSQAETYRKAQNALEQFLAATQRECDDILECSAPQQQEQQLDGDKINDDITNIEESELPEIYQNQPEKEEQRDQDFIPQVDGAFDDVPLAAPVSDQVHNVTDDADKMEIDDDNAIAVEEVKVVHGTGINQPSREAYVSRDRVRTSGQYLSASMRFLAAAENEKEEVEEDDGDGVEDLADVQKQEVNGTIGDIVLSADLPPTQPIENLEEEIGFEEAEDVLEKKPDEIMREINPSPNPAPGDIAGPSLGNNILQNNGSNWWREEASQVPFEDLEWDLLDDDVGGEMPEDYVIDSMIYNKDDNDTAREDNIDVDNQEYLQQEMEYQQEEDTEIQVVKYSYRHPAPTESHLLSSGWDQGVLPIVHQGAHYSNRGHVPTRAPVFAGKEFRVPCTASAELPVFSNVMEKARVLFKQKENRGNFTRGVIAFTPVRKPPSRAETDSWLASQFAVGRGISNSGGANGKRSGSGAGFTMDPNTGKLVPVGERGKIAAAAAAGGSVDTSQALSGGGSAGDLLGTPSLASIPSSDRKKRLKSLHQQQQQQQQQRVYSTPEVELLGGVKSNNSLGADGGNSGSQNEKNGQKGGGNEEEQQEHMRPPSPKYDEASFFYNNPFISDAAPSFRGGGGTGGGRSRLSTQGRKTPIAAGTSPALGSNNPQSANTGHQRAYGQQQQQPMSTRKSALKPPPQQQQPVLVEASQGSKDAAGAAAEERKSKKSVAFTPEEDRNLAPAVAAVPAAATERAVAAAEEIPINPTKPKPKARSQFVSQITPPSLGGGKTATPSSQLGFKRIVAGKGQGLTLASIEVHADCRGQLLPDPRYDAVRAVVIAVTDDEEDVPDGNFFARLFLFDGEITEPTAAGAAPTAQAIPPPAAAAAAANTAAETTNTVNNLDDSTTFKLNSTVDGLTGCQIERFPTEAALFDAVIAAVRALDPDIVLGYEIQKESLGYLSDRAAVAYQRTSLLKELSRMPPGYGKATQKDEQKEQGTSGGGGDGGEGGRGDGFGDAPGGGSKDQYGWDHASGLDIPGRIVLNVWRLMRGELKLNIYTLENCAAAVLRLRVPHIPAPQRAAWFSAGPSGGRWRCLSHLILRARVSLALLDRLDLITRTSEMARTFGIDFFSVLSRGSQYRVESMTLRLAHSQNYVAVAPSPEQVARQPAMEALPLVMEPRSALYPDPVCVLDFQSLYPSMIIAYNLCYSTCVGKPAHAAAAATAAVDGASPSSFASYKVKLGCSEYVTPLQALSGGKPGAQGLNIAPNGVAFVPPAVRPGILPRLLNEILSTRIMVKAAMKRAPSSLRVLLRCLNARQFGLKLIANVTYGYTAAGFSGRMPMAELADAIVQSGRATLEAAISMVENHPNWKAKVVYGDTDSLFVQLPGRTIEVAFAIGAEIAAAVTAANPPPVTLKLEKVYRPCVLLSKKRYVGAMYESPSQKVPSFDAKGIETVRRDACPAVAKIMEKTLRLLFATGDLSTVRVYLEKQWTRILSGRVSISDFIFAKEVRLGTYSARAAVVPPAALVATRAMAADPRAEPRYGERVPYVVVYGEPGARLADMVVPPRALVESGGRLRLHAVYYITKQIIPAIERALSLVGADVRAWFTAMPRPQRTLPQKRPQESLPLLPDGGMSSGGGGGAGMVPRAPTATTTTGLGGGAGALTIDRFYLSRHCAVCDELTHASKPLCERCLTEPQLAAAVLASRCNRLGRQYTHLLRVCGACGGGGGTSNLEEGGIVCDSLDCGVYFERRKVWRELQAAEALGAAGLKALTM